MSDTLTLPDDSPSGAWPIAVTRRNQLNKEPVHAGDVIHMMMLMVVGEWTDGRMGHWAVGPLGPWSLEPNGPKGSWAHGPRIPGGQGVHALRANGFRPRPGAEGFVGPSTQASRDPRARGLIGPRDPRARESLRPWAKGQKAHALTRSGPVSSRAKGPKVPWALGPMSPTAQGPRGPPWAPWAHWPMGLGFRSHHILRT